MNGNHPNRGFAFHNTIRPALWIVIVLGAIIGFVIAQEPGEAAGDAAPGPERLTARSEPSAPAVALIKVGDEVRTEARQRRRLVLPDESILYVDQNTTVKLATNDLLILTAGQILVDSARRTTVPATGITSPKHHVTDQKAKDTGSTYAVRADGSGTSLVVTRGEVAISEPLVHVSAGQQLKAGDKKPSPSPRASHLLDWTRDLMATAESPLVPGSKHTGGALIAIDPNGQEAKLSLRKYHIDVYIEDGFARTTIDQTYFNLEPFRMEGTFYFPLPPDASLSRLAMYVDGNLMEGGMVERDYGRQVFESIMYRQKDPALLEWVDGSTFKMRVFPLEGRQEKRIILSYTQRLPVLYGRTAYRFPAGHSLGVVNELSFRARLKDGAGLAWSSDSHTLKATKDGADLILETIQKNVKPDRDLALELSERETASGAQFSMAEQEGAKYLMLRYRPDLVSPQRKQGEQRNWVFLFESSGDRDPLLARTQIEIVRNLLAQAGPDDTFAVLTAATRVRSASAKPQAVTAENIKEALAFLEKAHLIGALDLGRALTEAEPYLKAGKNPYLVHLGSGIAAMGERREDVLAKHIPVGTRYVGIGVGRRWARNFMKSAAECSGGYFTQINPDESITWRSFDLVSTLNTPRLLNIKVAENTVHSPFRTDINSLAQGEELWAVARIDGRAGSVNSPMPESVTITGLLDGQRFEKVIPVKNVAEHANYLPRTWAKLEIDRLLAENAGKNKKDIVELSKAMYVMTPFTSLLVLENEDMYTQYKVDRGRKDHWAMYGCPANIPVVYEPLPGWNDGRNRTKGTPATAAQVLRTIAMRGTSNSVQELRDAQRVDETISETPFLPAVEFPGAVLVGSAKVNLQVTNGEFLNRALPDISRGLGDRLRSSSVKIAGWADFDYNQKRDKYGGHSRISHRVINTQDASTSFVPLSPEDRVPQRLELQRPYDYRSPVSFGFQGRPAHSLQNWMLAGPSDGPVDAETRRMLLAYYGIEDKEVERSDGLSYHRPSWSQNDRQFFDLATYCPGMNTSLADVRAVLETEAPLTPNSLPGTIDPAARKLFEKAVPAGWQSVEIASAKAQAAGLTITFDGAGRYAYERVVFPGIKEQVICDGKTLLHIYPDLGIGARRTVTRFHRMEFARIVPWALPPVEDLARGADLKLVDEHTVALIPHGVEKAKDAEGKQLPYAVLHFVFGADGKLVERQVVEMPSKKVLQRETASGAGKLNEAKAPDLAPDVKKLVVLQLPYRSMEHVRKTLKIENKALNDLRFEDALVLFGSAFGGQRANDADTVFRQSLHSRGQRQIGFYVLLAACGLSLDAEHGDVLSEYPNEPLAQYLALYSSPVLRKHASQWAVSTEQWKEGALQHLAVTHALFQRWQSNKIQCSDAVELKRALDYVRRNKGTAFGWALLGMMQDRANAEEADKKDVSATYRALAEVWLLFEDMPGMGYATRYEQARCLWKSGQKDAGRKQFRELYEKTLKEDVLPAIDSDFRQALQGDGKGPDQWSEVLRETAKRMVERKQRAAILLLARQCWQLGDQPSANQLLAIALDGISDEKERQSMTLAAIDFLMETSQWMQADELVQKLLADPKLARKPGLWRLAVTLAEKREMKARQMECLERALETEYQNLPEVINLQTVRSEYGSLLAHYENLAEAMVTLKVKPPPDFLAKVIRTADRWRALDSEASTACDTTARILQTLGDRDLGWDYLTTPIAMHPNEAGPWVGLAQTLSRKGEMDLADRAYTAAFEAEPTDAQILWDRADLLDRAGKRVQAQKLFRQLAGGEWQPRFNALKGQARQRAEGR